MKPIVTPAEMQQIDAQTTIPLDELINRAGWFVARRARSMLGGVYGRRVTVVAGPGNNGADARVAAGVLDRWGVAVRVVAPDVREIPNCDLIIDGAYGTGTNRPYERQWHAGDIPVLAIDIPSGVAGLTGELLGNPAPATCTVTFAALKPGLLLPPGRDHCGEIELVDIDLDASTASAWLFTNEDAAQSLPMRAAAVHKWRQAVWVIGGSPGMYGAPMLASQAAQRTGAGIVRCSIPGQAPPSVPSEVVFHALTDVDWHDQVLTHAERFDAFVVGPGIGRSAATRASVQALVRDDERPMVIDGDALHLLGDQPRLRPNIVLTPHDGEFAALTGHAPGADRFAAARELAAATGATALLKGPLTIVAEPGGRCLASASGDQRLATAGTGDVLAGTIGSYLAAGLEPAIAAVLGAWMHGAAGSSQQPIGMIASDLLPGLTVVAERLVRTGE